MARHDKTSQPVDGKGQPVKKADPVKRNFPKVGDSIADDLIDQSGRAGISGGKLTPRPSPAPFDDVFQRRLLSSPYSPQSRGSQEEHAVSYRARSASQIDAVTGEHVRQQADEFLRQAGRSNRTARSDEFYNSAIPPLGGHSHSSPPAPVSESGEAGQPTNSWYDPTGRHAHKTAQHAAALGSVPDEDQRNQVAKLFGTGPTEENH